MLKISVIIPIYNTVEYLRRCLDSVCNQTYTNLEIICIDDGSNDGSETILDEYAVSDERIIAIHQNNSGESNARNVGLKNASGDLVAFCDCDDWLELDMYETLVNEIVKYDLDMAAGGWFKSYDTEEIISKNLKPVKQGVLNRDELLGYIYERDAYQGFAYLWDKLFKKEILINASGEMMLFDEDISLGGDVIFLAEIALNTTKSIYVDKGFYHYYQRNNSGCHTENLEKRKQWLKSYEIVIKLFEENQIKQSILDYVKRFLAYHSYNTAIMAFRQKNDTILEECKKLMHQYKNEYERCNLEYPDRIEKYRAVLSLNILE
ncbi:MAG: glycosyltransferase family 2 protein [Lachnospira sp.]